MVAQSSRATSCELSNMERSFVACLLKTADSAVTPADGRTQSNAIHVTQTW